MDWFARNFDKPAPANDNDFALVMHPTPFELEEILELLRNWTTSKP
jgi:hypothetical protein